MIDPRLIQDIQHAEGCRLTAYRDSRGFWTIGYGHFLYQKANWEGHQINQGVADQLLEMDIETAAESAETLPEWKALDTAARQNAVIELVFNMGLPKWREFVHAREALAQNDWDRAASQLLESDWSHQVQPDGLTFPGGSVRPGRATRLAAYLRTGEYPS